MIYIETGSTDVYYNFGLEYYFTLEKRLPETVFLFWRTTPTLMVGKYQNVLEEINKPYADEHGIHLVRRMSGGGTIYTDMGGWQFTFIQHKEAGEIEFSQYIAPVIGAPSTGWATASCTTAPCCSIRTSRRWWRPPRWTATRSPPRASSPSGIA